MAEKSELCRHLRSTGTCHAAPVLELSPRRSYVNQKSVLPAELIARMADFARGVVCEKLVERAEDMCISGPRTNDPKAEVLLNTKIAEQYSKDRPDFHDLPAISRRCAQCRGSENEEHVDETRARCCVMGIYGCEECVGRRYVCPEKTCGVEYTRRWAYETGSGRGSIGRNRAQFRIRPFTPEMHSVASLWSKQSGQCYNNMVLVTYCGANMCAHCACDLPHGSIQCGTILKEHQDNGQGGPGQNSQALCSINRTLNVGDPRTLTMSLAKHLGAGYERPIPDSEVHFNLTHGSEMVLDTQDEVECLRQTAEGRTRCSWKHGMTTPIKGSGISCGYVARHVQRVCDVRLDNDVIIDPTLEVWQDSERGRQFQEAGAEWRNKLCKTYVEKVGPRIKAALLAWERRSTRHTLMV